MRLSEKTAKMSESRSVSGHFVFYRTKKFGFKKKLEHFEHKVTIFIRNHSDLLLESQ